MYLLTSAIRTAHTYPNMAAGQLNGNADHHFFPKQIICHSPAIMVEMGANDTHTYTLLLKMPKLVAFTPAKSKLEETISLAD